MPNTLSHASTSGLRLFTLSALALAAAVCILCACGTSAAQTAATPQATATPTATPKLTPKTSRPVVAVVSTAGASIKGYDEREMDISLNPCKGETPGNVLGVSEQGETSKRVAGFVAKLRDADPKARACAARQLGYLGAEARDALPQLIRRLREEEHSGVGGNLSEALWAVGPDTRATPEEWLESARAGDAEVRLYAAFALGYYRPHPARQKRVVAALAAALRDKESDVRWMAVRGLMRLGPTAADAVPDLLAVLLDEQSKIRHLAAMALGNIGPAAELAAPELLKVYYATQDFTLYTSVSIALGRIGAPVVPLIEKDFKTKYALRAVDLLDSLVPHGARLLVEALSVEDKKVRAKAIDASWKYGAAAEPAVPLLVKALKDPDADLRGKAAHALYVLGPVAKAAAPELLAALGDQDVLVQCYAAKGMGKLGSAGAPAVPELKRMMSVPRDEAGKSDLPRRCAAEALIQMGPETRALVPAEVVKEVEEQNTWLNNLGSSRYVDETKPKPKPKSEPKPTDW